MNRREFFSRVGAVIAGMGYAGAALAVVEPETVKAVVKPSKTVFTIDEDGDFHADCPSMDITCGIMVNNGPPDDHIFVLKSGTSGYRKV